MQKNYISDTWDSASYIDLHLGIDNRWKSTTKLYQKCYDFTIVNFLFVSSNIAATPVYRIYISQFIHNSGDWSQYIVFFGQNSTADSNIAQTMLCRSYMYVEVIAIKLYRLHYELIDRYEILITQMAIDLLPDT